MALGRACCRAWAAAAAWAADMLGCWLWLSGVGITSAGERVVEASVCCTERMVWASADSAAA